MMGRIFNRAFALAVLAVTLGGTTANAQASLLGAIAGKVAEHVAERQGVTHSDDHLQKSTLTPGSFAPQTQTPMQMQAQSNRQGFSQCRQLFPNNTPLDIAKVDTQWRPIGLCSSHFAVLYSPLTKTPLVVVEKLNQALLKDAQSEERTNQFYADPRLARGERSELSDYEGSCADKRKSCFDRGHMANAADQPDQTSMVESFALSNMIPQDPGNNRKGAWLKAEKDTRKYVRRATGDVFVFSGPLFLAPTLQTIGANKVWVPSHLFKLVYDASTGQSWAYIMVGTEMQLQAPVSYAEFVQKTGWRLLD